MISKIKYPEWIGAIICLAAAGFISFNFNKLDTITFQVIGIAAILLLLLMPAVSLMSLGRFNLTQDLNKPYAETLRQFAFQKLRFQKFQQANALLSYLLLVTIFILLPKFFNGKDITNSRYFWIFVFSFGYIFLLFAIKWVKKFYNNSLKQAEELLKELKS